MAKLLLVVVTLFIGLAFTVSDEETILWGTKKLTWDDFKGKPDPKHFSVASTLSEVDFDFKHISKDSILVIIKAVFYPYKSFTVYKDRVLLEHESGHFDISELYARKMRKKVSETSFHYDQYKIEITRIYNQLNSDLDKYQDKYDLETDHSMALEKQKEWQESILSDIKSLDDYAPIAVPVHFGKD